MISNLSSLIQLFAAIYLTMCFENTFLSRFWAPVTPQRINKAFEQLRLPKDVKPIVKNRTRFLPESFEKRMRKRGTFMLIVSVFLLIVIGFEKGIATRTGYSGLSFGYIVFAILVFIFFLADRRIMGNWRGVYICISILLGLFSIWTIIVPFFSCYGSFWMQYRFWLKLLAKVSIILAVVLPVVWLLFVNWLYSKYYLKYVISELSKESNENKKSRDKVSGIEFYPDFFPLLRISLQERRKEKKSKKSK